MDSITWERMVPMKLARLVAAARAVRNDGLVDVQLLPTLWRLLTEPKFRHPCCEHGIYITARKDGR